jgi:hypothetical protein
MATIIDMRAWRRRGRGRPAGGSGENRPRRGGGGGGGGGLRTMALAGALLGLLYANGSAWMAPTIAAPGGQGASIRVVDGDTFWLGGEKIRIADIDTPEVAARCPEEAELAGRATRRLETLLREAPFELAQVAGRDEDRYGRKLRIVTRGGRSVGDMLVAEGLARTWTGRREPWCA